LLLPVFDEARITPTLVILSAANGPLYWLLLLFLLLFSLLPLLLQLLCSRRLTN